MLHGEVLYLSAAETNALYGRPVDPLVPIVGKTFDVKETLKAMGAKWDPDKRTWMIAQSKITEAQEVVRKGPQRR